ncbi:hypothetical protein Leryth_006039 [Lithospermum erythrorhizon]|nr:hypothetical protein Leryth_006039 [Lithospermum erythrorhizon]
MVNTTKTGGSAMGGGGGGFRGKMEHYLYSGDKKHVLGGMVIICGLFAVPWYFMSRGSKHQSHQDYMEKADRARKERLSSGGSSVKTPIGS